MAFKYPQVLPVLKYSKNAETRKTVYVIFNSRCNDNDEILAQAVKLRAEIVLLLGYENHSAFVLENCMAKTPEPFPSSLMT